MTGFWSRSRCKTYAAPRRGPARPCAVPGACEAVPRCANEAHVVIALVQGIPVLLGMLFGLLTPGVATGANPRPAPACAGPVLRVETWAPGLWQVLAQPGEATAANRGQVSNLVLAADGGRLWLLGSGPSPAFGRALACQVRQQLGRSVTDVVSPWARPELVLGAKGLASAGPLRHWAHAEVAAAMAEQCPQCVARLRKRLGAAAGDLGAAPIPRPTHLLHGGQGRLGPWRWWRLPRSAGRVVTVWRHQTQPIWVAPGLLGGSGAPDGRDADLALLAESSGRLAALVAEDGAEARLLGEQGAPMAADAALRHQAYWLALLAQARAAIERGESDTRPAPAWPDLPPDWAAHPWHALNWQRAWRQVEPEVLAR